MMGSVKRLDNKKSTRKNNIMKNTKRMNRLEELGRVDSEKAKTKKGKKKS
jgi:hypothetical protein